MEIKPYEQKYLSRLKEIFSQNVPEYFDADEWSDFENFVAKESCPYFVVEADGIITGAFGYAMDDATTGAIVWIFFDPTVQSRGQGTAAIAHCHEGIQSLGGKSVRSRTSQKTEGFFAKMG